VRKNAGHECSMETSKHLWCTLKGGGREKKNQSGGKKRGERDKAAGMEIADPSVNGASGIKKHSKETLRQSILGKDLLTHGLRGSGETLKKKRS